MKLMKCLPVLFLAVPLLASCNQEHKHSYDFNHGKWFWSETETGYAASLTVTCNQCAEGTEGHTLELEATVTTSVVNPTCVSDGETIYTATVEYDGKSYSDQKEFSISALGHEYSSIIVDGEYPKTYMAFDHFDDSNIIVKAVCERCGDEVIISPDEYFIVYSAFGADCLSVGDTFVTISYQGKKVVLDGLTVSPIIVNAPIEDPTLFTYDGEEQVYAVEESDYYTVTGNKETDAGDYNVVISLNDKTNYVWDDGTNDDIIYHFTINKAANEIVGFLDSYETTCCIHPDFSGVYSAANDITFTYYLDEEMTEEVLESDLAVGSYYIKAVSGGNNYEQVVKTATLTVSHSFEHEVMEERYLKTPASEDNNAVYYKSCACGLASDRETFVAEGTILPSLVATTSYEPSEVVDEIAPVGYSVVSKGTIPFTDDDQGKEFLKNIDINNYSSVNFAFKTENRRFCGSHWENPIPLGEWHYVTITKNQDGTFSSAIKNEEGSMLISYESATSFRNSLLYYNWDGSEPNMVWYSTEVLGYKLDPIGDLVAESSVLPFERVVEPAPYGYSRVTKGTTTYSDANQGKTFLSNIGISRYSSVYFAFKTENRRFCNSAWGSPLPTGQWFFVTVTNNNDGTYTSVIRDANGIEKFGYANKASFAESLPYYNWDGSEPNMVWYSTEVRGTLL